MANDVTWDTESIPVAEGFYVSADIATFMQSTTQTEARTALGAASLGELSMVSRTTNFTKKQIGGVHCDLGAPSVELPITTAELAAAGSFSIVLTAQHLAFMGANVSSNILGSVRASGNTHTGGIGIVVASSGAYQGISLMNEMAANGRSFAAIPLPAAGINAQFSVIAEYNASTGEATITSSEGETATAAWPVVDFSSTRPFTAFRAATNAPTGSDDTRSGSGNLFGVSLYNRLLTSEEKQSIFSSGGQMIPISARSSCIEYLKMDDGGYQMKDYSGSNNHALLTATGCTNLIPTDSGSVAAIDVDATGATYLLRSGDILPVNAVVSSVIVDGSPIDLSLTSGLQNLSLMRIRIVYDPLENSITIQRSNGTTHQNLIDPSMRFEDHNHLKIKILYQIV